MEIREFLKKYNFRPNDLLGQNFLLNEETLDLIVNAAEIKKSDQVLEIGTGIANLTKRLAAKAGFLLTIEKDERYFPIIKEELGESLESHTKTPKSKSNVHLVFADATRFNFQELLEPGYKVVANIPYYITGKIVEMLLTAQKKPSKIVLLMQKEVAERIIAKPGEMSILSIAVQMFADAKIMAHVPKSDFYPVPKVDSSVLVLDVLKKPRFEIDEKKFFRLVRAAFSGKRKQIHNTLKNSLHLDDEKVSAALEKAKIDSKSRAQELNLKQWRDLYQALQL